MKNGVGPFLQLKIKKAEVWYTQDCGFNPKRIQIQTNKKTQWLCSNALSVRKAIYSTFCGGVFEIEAFSIS